MNKQSSIKKTILFSCLAFLLPFTIIAIVLALQGISFWGDRTILASDGFHQYVIFNQTLRNTLHGSGSLFYTFTSGLGTNFYALISYYLGSLLSPFVYFFNLVSMPDALYLFALVKFGLTGLTTYISLKKIYSNLTHVNAIILSSCYALISFSVGQLEINAWLDVFSLFPLILLGLDRIIHQKGRVLYFVTLSLLFIQNYYFGFMMAIFLTLWYLVQLSWDFKHRIRSFLDFALVSLFAAITSLIMLLPTYLDLRNHGETFTAITKLQTENSWFFDIFAKNIIGAFDTTKYGSIPSIYVGLLPLILSLLFFTLKSIHWKVKLSYATLLLFIITSFYLQPLDLFWQGMHAPNMFLHRYAWVFSLVILFMAAETLSRYKEIKSRQVLLIFTILTLAFGVTYFFKNHYAFLDDNLFVFTAEFLIAYFILLFTLSKKKFTPVLFSLLTVFFVLFELGINSYYQVQGIGNEWHFPTKENYRENLEELESIVNYTNNQESSFYRMERLQPQTGNDSMKYNYNGISQFSSIRNRFSSSTLDKLGFKSEGTNLNLRYQNNTILADSLFGVRYNISNFNPNKFGFQHVDSQGTLQLYQNQYASQLGILTKDVYKDVEFSNLFLDNQVDFLNQLTGLNYEYFSELAIEQMTDASTLDGKVTVNAPVNENTASFTINVKVPAHSQLYLSLPSLSFGNENSKQVQISVNNQYAYYGIDNTFTFFNAGYFDQDSTITIKVSFPNNQSVTFNSPALYRLNTDEYQEAFQYIKSQHINTVTKGNTVTTQYQSDRNTSIVYTLPYDKGWKASLNGQPLTISKVQTGLMKVDVPEGQGEVVLTFIPEGFTIGVYAFFTGILLFSGYDYLRRKSAKRKSKNSVE